MVPQERVREVRAAIAALPRAARPDVVQSVWTLALQNADRASGVVELCPRCWASGARVRASGLVSALRELERLGAVGTIPGARNANRPDWPVWRVNAAPAAGRAPSAD